MAAKAFLLIVTAPGKSRGVAILELAKSKVKGGIDMIRGLVSRQPV